MKTRYSISLKKKEFNRTKAVKLVLLLTRYDLSLCEEIIDKAIDGEYAEIETDGVLTTINYELLTYGFWPELIG